MHRTMVAAVAVSLAMIFAALERISGMGSTLWVLTFVPVAIAAWYTGWRWGTAVGLLSVVLALLVPGPGTTAVSSEVNTTELVVRMLLLAAFSAAVQSGKSSVDRNREPIRSDPSTGLANFRGLFDTVSREVDRANRYRRPFTLAYVAVENLPAVHRRAGEHAAEEVMRRVAHHIRGSLRGVDLAARLRDREFALLLPETGVDAARAVLGRIERSLTASLADEPLAVSFSIGAITWLSAELPVKDLHQRTYQLMYTARRTGSRLEHEVLDLTMSEPMRVPYLTTVK